MTVITIKRPSARPFLPFPYTTFADLPLYDFRYMPRWEGVTKRVFYRITGVPLVIRTQMTDLSLNGIGLYVSQGTKIDQRLEMRIHLSHNVSFEAEGRVLWKRPADDHLYIAGVQFEKLPQQTQNLIVEHSFEIPRHKGPRGG